MPGTLEDAIKEAYATARSDVVYLDTLEITNVATDPLYLVKDRQDHTLTLETGVSHLFTATAFRFVLPSAGDNGLQDLTLAVDNVDRRITQYIKTVMESNQTVQVAYRPFMAHDKTKPQMTHPLILFLTDVVITAAEVTGRATFADVLNRKYLNDLYVRRRFPAL